MAATVAQGPFNTDHTADPAYFDEESQTVQFPDQAHTRQGRVDEAINTLLQDGQFTQLNRQLVKQKIIEKKIKINGYQCQTLGYNQPQESESGSSSPTSARAGSSASLPRRELIRGDSSYYGGGEEGETQSVLAEPVASPQAETEKVPFLRRCGQAIRKYFQATYFVSDSQPDIVLPSPPNDEEKLSYLTTHRFLMTVFGFFGFISASVGIWLFVVSGSPAFYFFGVFAAFSQVYLLLFHITGALSRNYDYKEHQDINRTHAVSLDSENNTEPTVDIFLPCCKEGLEILENTYKYAQKVVYAPGKLQVHVLDDGAMDEVKELAERYGFNYIRRDDRPHLKKAGNLRYAFARTTGDFFAIFDADFCPRWDFLLETIPRMKAQSEVALIQTPQYFRTAHDWRGGQTWVERGAGAVQEVFYRYIQPNRNRWNASICVGSCALYRREPLIDFGGTAAVGASEDVHTGFYLVNKGLRLWYMPINLANGICPDTTRAFFSQQIRWCEGSTSLLLNRYFWKSNLTWKQRSCYLSGMLYYSNSALQLFFQPLPALLLIWIRIDLLLVFNLAFALPAIIYGLWMYRFWGRSKHARSVQLTTPIQGFAYACAIKDHILGTTYNWVPSGDGKAHKSTRYRNTRWFCIAWTFTHTSVLTVGIVLQWIAGHTWYSFLPIIALSVYSLHNLMPFMLAA